MSTGAYPRTPALAAQARFLNPSHFFYWAYPRTPAPSRAFPILLTQNPGPGRSADADFEPFHFPCKPSPGIFAAHSLRKFADASPRQPSPRAHEVDSVREKPSGAHGTRKSSVPYARETLVRTEPAACARRCFTTPHCSTGRRTDGQTGRRRSARTSSAPQSAQTATGPLHHKVSATVSPNRSQPKQRSVQTEVSPNRRHPKMARMSSTICSSIRRLSERSCPTSKRS